MSDLPTLPESVRFSKLPSCCVELIWASGDQVLAMPTIFISSAEWQQDEASESVVCDWGAKIVTLSGHGLQRLPGCLVRGEVCVISEIQGDRAEVLPGSVVTKIEAIEKKTPDSDSSDDDASD